MADSMNKIELEFYEYVRNELTELRHPYTHAMTNYPLNDSEAKAKLFMAALRYEVNGKGFGRLREDFLKAFSDFQREDAGQANALKPLGTACEVYIKKLMLMLNVPMPRNPPKAWGFVRSDCLNIISDNDVASSKHLTKPEEGLDEDVAYWSTRPTGEALIYRARRTRNGGNHGFEEMNKRERSDRFNDLLSAFLYVTDRLKARLFELFLQEYCDNLIDDHIEFHRPGGNKRVSLRDIYIENVPLDEGNTPLDLDNLPQKAVVVILGEQGSGKSTLLKRLAQTYAQAFKDPGKKTPLPILVKLSDYEKDANTTSLTDYVLKTALKITPEFILPALLRDGQCLMLLDGYEEVTGGQVRWRIDKRIDELYDGYMVQGNRLVLGSRRAAFTKTCLASPQQCFYLNTLTEEKQRQFLGKWIPVIGPSIDARELVNRIMQDKRPGVRKLAANPLHLLQIAILRANSLAPIPETRSELYRQVSEVLLHDWQLDKSVKTLNLQDANLVLAEWAGKAKFGEHHGTSLSENDFMKWTKDSRYVETLKESREMLGWLQQCELVTTAGNKTQIAPPFDDYYAAQWLTSKNEQIISYIVNVKYRTGWREATLLALEMLQQQQSSSFALIFRQAIYPSRADPYERILHRDLLLAGESLTRVGQIETRLANQVLEALFDLWISNSGAYQLTLLRVNIEGIFSGLQLEYAMTLFDRVRSGLEKLSGEKLAAVISVLRCLKPSLTQTQIDDVSSLLNRYMTDGDDKVRAATIDILVVFDRLALSVEERLSLMQTSSSEEIRSATIRSCTYLDPIDRRLVNRLFASLNDEGAIGKIAASTLVELAGRDKYIADQIKQQLASSRSPMVQQGLLTALNITPRALLREEFFPQILSLARKSQDVDVCWKALRLLGTYFSERQETMQILRSCLQEKSSSSWRRVRIECVRQLRNAENDSDRVEAVRSLKTAIEQDEYKDVIEEAQKSLEFLGNSEFLPILDESKLLRSSTTGIVPDRTKAISRLGLLKAPSPKAVDACIQLSSHNNQNIRDAALAALSKISAKIDVSQKLASSMCDILVDAIENGTKDDVKTASANLLKVLDRITVAKLDSNKRNDLADSLIELLASPLPDLPLGESDEYLHARDKVYQALSNLAQAEADLAPD